MSKVMRHLTKSVVRSVAAAMLLSSAVAASAETDVRQPTGNWIVQFDDTQCVASRNFGTADKPLLLALKAPPLSKIMQLAVITPSGRGVPMQRDATVTWEGGAEVKTTLLAFSPSRHNRVHLINMPTEQFAAAPRATWIRIKASDALDETFRVEVTPELLQTLTTCVDDLEQFWNHGKAKPEGDLRGVIKGDDYPAVAVNKNQQGSVRVVILVDESGKIAECTLIETSGIAVLDAQACALIKARAKLKPGRDSSDKPVRSLLEQSLTWRLEP